MRKLLSLGLVLLATGTCPAAEVQIFGAEKPVRYFAELSVKTEKGDQASWMVFPLPGKLTDNGDGKLYLAGPPGTKYTVFVTVINFDQRRLDKGQAEVVMAGDAPPPPPDGPTVKTFQEELQDAVRAEVREERINVPRLADFYDAAAKVAAENVDRTWADYLALVAGLSETNKTAGTCLKVQAAVAKELKKTIPWREADLQAPMGADGRKLAADAFKRMAASVRSLTIN